MGSYKPCYCIVRITEHLDDDGRIDACDAYILKAYLDRKEAMEACSKLIDASSNQCYDDNGVPAMDRYMVRTFNAFNIVKQ